MQQLTYLDTLFLNMETPVQQGHVGGLVVIDPATADGAWTYQTLHDVIEERLHLLPPFRRRLAEVPLDLDYPYWIEDPNFDLTFHLRHIAVPAPGDGRQLADLVARIHERPLDRTRPLWEMYLIEGLSGGRLATYTKLHHAMIDGLAGTDILTVLLDTDPEGRAIDPPDRPWKPEAIPLPVELLGRTFVRALTSPARLARAGYELARMNPVLKAWAQLPKLTGLDDNEDFLSRPSLIAPRTLLNEPISAHRRWAYGDIPLEKFKTVKNAHGTTVNDVVLAACGGAIRDWLSDHEDLPQRSLQALVPISVRGRDQHDFGNRVSGMIVAVGTHIDDPLERLRYVHEHMAAAKEVHNATPAEMLADLAQFAPPAVSAAAAQYAFRSGRAGRWTPFSMVISNIPGPHIPLYYVGAKLEGHYPISTITDGAALNITLHSYLGNLCFGVVADRELVPDVWDLLDHIEKEVDRLVGLSA